ncbi:MAG: STAS-like domain-containing protein [Lachnospiraceae bacterium]|nr:STAS-like domain-containing protein [Lachnospiraceae bacterium]
MNTIIISTISNEAASKTKGLLLKERLDPLLSSKKHNIVVDFSGITRFASPFFNHSFAALALVYGFEQIRSIKIENISEVGQSTYQTSMENAEMVAQYDKQIEEINQIIDNTPKKVTP